MQITYTTLGVTEITKEGVKGKVMTSAGKFRISLSLAQIDWILANCKADLPELHSQLTLIKFKADSGLTKPAYSLAPERERIPKPPTPAKKLPIESIYKNAVLKRNSGMILTSEEKDAYDEYRYLNDLMTAEEADAYEKEALAIELSELGDGECKEQF